MTCQIRKVGKCLQIGPVLIEADWGCWSLPWFLWQPHCTRCKYNPEWVLFLGPLTIEYWRD